MNVIINTTTGDHNKESQMVYDFVKNIRKIIITDLIYIHQITPDLYTYSYMFVFMTKAKLRRCFIKFMHQCQVGAKTNDVINVVRVCQYMQHINHNLIVYYVMTHDLQKVYTRYMHAKIPFIYRSGCNIPLYHMILGVYQHQIIIAVSIIFFYFFFTE